MNELSVMTIGFFEHLIIPYYRDKDVCSLHKRYRKLFSDICSLGIKLVDMADFEVNYIGEDYLLNMLGDLGMELNCYITMGEFARRELPKHIPQAIAFCKRAKIGKLMLVSIEYPSIADTIKEEIHKNYIKNFSIITNETHSSNITCIFEDTPNLSLHLCKTPDVKNILSNVDGLQFVYDSANMLFAGEDPIAYARNLSGKIAHVHLKDIKILDEKTDSGERMPDGRKTVITPPGEGLVPFKIVIPELHKLGYTGNYVIEISCNSEIKSAIAQAKKYYEDIFNKLI